MKQRTHFTLCSVLLAAVLIVLSGCDPVATLGEGTLLIRLESSSRNLTLLPEIDMQIATHTITGTGPDGAGFTEEGFEGSVFVTFGLAVGDWAVTIDGYNADGTKIGTATEGLVVRKSRTTSATATLRPLEGMGSLNWTVSWTDSQGMLGDPQMWVTLRGEEGKDIEGISIPTRLEVEGCTARGSAELPAGWYEMTVELYGGVPGGGLVVVWQGVLVFQIVSGQTTSGTLEIPEDMDDPFDVFFTISPEAVVAGGDVTFTSTGSHSDSARYRWYVDGERQVGSASVLSHIFEEAGVYAVSLLVLDGGVLCGYGESVTVVEDIGYAVGGLGPSGGYVFYDKGLYSDGWRYLEAAPAGWSGVSQDPSYIFGYYRKTSIGAKMVVGTGTAVGAGEANTAALITAMGSTAYTQSIGTEKAVYAAKVCAGYMGGGYVDWFLPSKDELNLMYQNLNLQGLGGFSGLLYWSSSEYDGSNAWFQRFDLWYQNYITRSNRASRVRPVRAF